MRFLPPTDQKCAESLTYWQFFYYRPPGKFRFTHLGEIVKMPRTQHIYIIYIYDALDNRYGFSISVQHGIDCTTFHSFFSWKVWKKMFFKIFKSWQVCDWLAKWIIMLRFMDLRWPRVFRRSNVGLVDYVPIIVSSWNFQELSHWTRVRSMQKVKVKGQGHRGQDPNFRFRTVTPVWIHIWWWNDTYSLMLLRRGALLFFKVIRQISRSHGAKIAEFDPDWAFPDCNSSLNSPMAMKCYTKLEVA